MLTLWAEVFAEESDASLGPLQDVSTRLDHNQAPHLNALYREPNQYIL